MAAKVPKVGRNRLDRSKTGRKKGTPNKTTQLLKDAILKAAEKAGGKGRADIRDVLKDSPMLLRLNSSINDLKMLIKLKEDGDVPGLDRSRCFLLGVTWLKRRLWL